MTVKVVEFDSKEGEELVSILHHDNDECVEINASIGHIAII